MNLADRIDQLERLRELGTLSEKEFQQAKEKLMGGHPDPKTQYQTPVSGQLIHGIEERTFCTLMHISQLLVYAGGVGIVVPIVMWILGKDQSPLVARHGARMMNWIFSSFIYGCVVGVLCLLFVGIPFAIALAILAVVFPVIAAMKANRGQLWSYPMAIKFLPEV